LFIKSKMSFTEKEIRLLNKASRDGNEDAKNLVKRWNANNDNSKDHPFNAQDKKNLWKTMEQAGACGLLFLFGSVLLSLMWGAIDMGSSVTEGRHEINHRNYTGWEVGFGTFYFMSWWEDNKKLEGDPGLVWMNVGVLFGYIGILYGIFSFLMYATYDGSFYTQKQIQEEDRAIYNEAVEKKLITQEMEPLLYNNTQLKF